MTTTTLHGPATTCCLCHNTTRNYMTDEDGDSYCSPCLRHIYKGHETPSDVVDFLAQIDKLPVV